MSPTGFLGRALMDPATGLPNLPYFGLIQQWEQRRAQRRRYAVRVVAVRADGGDDRTRRSLGWRLCQELRTSDLIASEGRGHYRILLTSPDAERAESVRERIEALAAELNVRHPAPEPLVLHVEVETPESRPDADGGPCTPCDADAIPV
jgi:GGDEF domain-containing protein